MRYLKNINILAIALVLCLAAADMSFAADQLSQGYKHYHSGNTQAAVKLLTAAVKGDHKGNAKAHYYLGNAWMKLGRPHYARHYYKRTLQLGASEPLASYCKAALAKTQAGGGAAGGAASRSGEKGAVGIGINGKNEVVHVQKNSGAERAGLKIGDKLTSIDGKSLYGLGIKSIGKLVTGGPPGSTVTLGVHRGGKSMKIAIVRGTLKSSKVTGARPTRKKAGRSKVTLTAEDSGLIKIHKNRKTKNSDYVYNEVAAALAALNKPTKDVFRAGGCTVLIAPTILDARPDLRSVKPRGYLHGGSYHNCPGMYAPSKKTLYIAERAAWRNSPPQLNRWAHTTALHELGHAYDHFKGNLSGKSEFLKAAKKDHQRLTNTTREEYWYYTQPGAGYSELFAEIFAVIHGQGLDPREAKMPSVFPNTATYIRTLVGKQ